MFHLQFYGAVQNPMLYFVAQTATIYAPLVWSEQFREELKKDRDRYVQLMILFSTARVQSLAFVLWRKFARGGEAVSFLQFGDPNSSAAKVSAYPSLGGVENVRICAMYWVFWAVHTAIAYAKYAQDGSHMEEKERTGRADQSGCCPFKHVSSD